MNSNKIIVALDSNDINKIKKIANLIKKEVYAFKIGYEFFFNFGIDGYNQIKKIKPKIFLDLKLHDIPNTVKQGIKAIEKLRPTFTSIHISGGDEMLKSSVINRRNTKILGVSILTSLNKDQVNKYYNEDDIDKVVKKFVRYAKNYNLNGVVCSPKEIKYVRKEVGRDFIIVTPGIRPETYNSTFDDQKRTLTPKKAIDLGADFLVIGRPITESENPLEVVKKINQSLN